MLTSTHCLLLAALTLFQTTFAHSWNEQLAVIGAGGKYVGPYGYSRGYVARTDPGFDGESDKYQLPSLASGRTRIDNTDLLCHPDQRTANQTAKWPRLSVAPGSVIAMKYLENGHVTLPENQPGKPAPSRGTVYVFGTTQPSTTEKLTDILQWTKDGSGGDKRGTLLGANNFDDGRCHQINGGPLSTQRQASFPDPVAGQPGTHSELWCETDIVLPKTLTVGKPLTVYWVWDWPTAPGTAGLPTGKDEYYTTCSDLNVVAQAPSGPVSNLLTQQDPNLQAPANYLTRPAQAPLPRGQKPEAAPKPSVAAPVAPVPTHAAAAPAAPSHAAASQAVPVGPTTLMTAAATHAALSPAATTAAAAAPVAPAAKKVAITTMLAPGQGLLVGAGGMIFSYNLPTDGGVAAKVKRDVNVDVGGGVGIEDVRREVAGGMRYRMPRGGRRG